MNRGGGGGGLQEFKSAHLFPIGGLQDRTTSFCCAFQGSIGGLCWFTSGPGIQRAGSD